MFSAIKYILLLLLFFNIVEDPVSGQPREAEKVYTTGAGRLRECVNTECVSELEFKRGFVKAAVSRYVRLRGRVSALRELQLLFY